MALDVRLFVEDVFLLHCYGCFPAVVGMQHNITRSMHDEDRDG
jgi:hypothetical protein